SVAAGNTISGGGQLIAQGSGQLSGNVGSLQVLGTYDVPVGDTLAALDVTVAGSGQLALGVGAVNVTDSLVTSGAGHLLVNDPAAVVTVGGTVSFAGGVSSLTSGTLALSGDLLESLPGALSAAPTFTIRFQRGSGTQTVALASSDSLAGLGTVVMQGDTLRFATSAWVTGTLTLTSGVAEIADTLFTLQGVTGAPGAGVSGNTLWLQGVLSHAGTYGVGTTVFGGTGISIPALSVPYDTLVVVGNAALGGHVQAGNARVMGTGHLQIAGHRLDVAEALDLEESGVFEMTSAADTVMVGGDVLANGGSTTGLLTAGLLQIAGSFDQGNFSPGDAFHADTNHVTRFAGGLGSHAIFFATPTQPPGSALAGGPTSQFGTVEFSDGADTLLTIVPVAYAVNVQSATVLGSGTLAAAGPIDVAAGAGGIGVSSLYSGGGLNYLAPPATFTAAETFFFGGPSIPVLPYQWLRVGFATLPLTGDVTATQVTIGGQGELSTDSYGGELDLNGHALQTSGDFALTGFGTLRMDQAADSLDVGGSFNATGGSTSGLVTDGVIVARGAVYVAPNWDDSSFIATGANRFRMAGAGAFDLGLIQGTTAANRFSKFSIDAGTTANFNQFQNGALI
ncbi:MAG TPA: hypothetical protein VFI13_06915, partial [Gemmatimonadales bacterium]|nr:hypothetical protein [Gemmatimonadales bacterium]